MKRGLPFKYQIDWNLVLFFGEIIDLWGDLDFIELNDIKDEITPQINNITKEKHKVSVDLVFEGETSFHELHLIKEAFSVCGTFDITTFDSENRFG